MDNAAKALIIAGAILISILLIAISMYVYNSAQGTVNQAGAQMTAQEKDMYNSKINSYVGNSKPGVDVKSLIEAVISSNNGNMTDSGKFIAIQFKDFANATGKFNGHTADAGGNSYNLAANSTSGTIGKAGESNNTEKFVSDASNDMNALKAIVNTGKRYDIETKTSSTGLVILVIISELGNTTTTTTTGG